MDFSLTSRSKVDSYKSFITKLKSKYTTSLTHRQLFSENLIDSKNYLLLRHDVDHDLEKARDMAVIEAELGIFGSYYLLPPGDYDSDENYYGIIKDGKVVHKQSMITIAKQIQDLGHEIGLHNDFLQLATRTGRSLESLLLDEIAFFESEGIEIKGSASHGSRFAIASGYVNYEIFIDRRRSPEQLKRIQLKGKDNKQFVLPALAMQNVGLEYEAYDATHDVRISDVGGRLVVSNRGVGASECNFANGSLDKEIELSNGVCVVLIHSEHWTRFEEDRIKSTKGSEIRQNGGRLTKEDLFKIEAESNAPLFKRKDGMPFRVAVRGDCVCRRAVSMNANVFDNNFELVVNEKATNQQFVETLNNKIASLEKAREFVDFDAMQGSLKTYFEFQFDRSTLTMKDIDLLIMDTYSDMNFKMWTHKTEGWSMWIHPKFTDMDKLKECFNDKGFISFETAVDNAVKFITKVRENNPDVPVLYMYQPIEYYSKLTDRSQFYRLPQAVAERIPNVYPSDKISFDDLGTADLGSCGPGQTLHFDDSTYLRMINSSWNRGLSNHFRPQNKDDNSDEVKTRLPKDLKDFNPSNVEYSAISYGVNSQQCRDVCKNAADAATKSFAQYIFHPEVEELEEQPKRFTPMVIDFANNFDFEEFEAYVKTFGKGARLRQKRKALRQGYYCKLFAWKMHIPDIHEINHSKETRSGGAMRGSYLRTIEEMGGAPDKEYSVILPLCNNHWSLTFGTFIKKDSHKQGSLEVGEKLIAYISLRRIGGVVLYSQIMGHGDYLDNGALILLHHEVVKWLDENRDSYSKNLQYIMYGGAQNGGQTLYQWKRQGGFKPLQLIGLSSDNKLEEWYESL